MDALIVHTNIKPLQYDHPFLIAQDPSSTALSIWTFENTPHTLYATLEGATSAPSCELISPSRLVTFDQSDADNNAVLVHSLPDGRLLDRKPFDALQARTYATDGDSQPLPAAGECTPLVASDGRIAVWRNGTDGNQGVVDVYELTDAGKLVLARHLNMPRGAPALEVRNIGYDYLLPDPVHLTAEYLIGAVVLYPSPTVHLIRWASSNGTQFASSHAELPCTRKEDENIILSATLQAHLFIPPSNQLVLAHHEYPSDFDDAHPVTALRSIDPDTLSLTWCTPLPQKLYSLHHHPGSDTLIAIGWAYDPYGMCIAVLDAQTGAVRRTDTVGDRTLYKSGGIYSVAGGVHCAMAPSCGDIVVVFGDGQVAVEPLAGFLERGFVKVGGKLGTRACPDSEVSTPRNAKERREAAAGGWAWVESAFVGEGSVVLNPRRGEGFVVLRWK